MTELSRRGFLKRGLAAGAAGAALLYGLDPAKAQAAPVRMASVIDLTKCDGCKGRETPLCVSACREQNQERFPEPQKPIHNYWPQKRHEDWSEQRHLTNRLTPYNWTYVERVTVEVDGKPEQISIPRRCMHCDNPTCMNVCPFSAIEQHAEGPVQINESTCMGGAKCRDVCPWGIPQRQAGVGLYMDLIPEYLGGGVMYKCDGCIDQIKDGEVPACQSACPTGAVRFGPRAEIFAAAQARAAAIGGYLYGDKENGGTSTLYVSKVPFEQIDAAIKAKKAEAKDTKPGRPAMPVAVGNFIDTPNGMALSLLIAPVAGVAAAVVAAAKAMKRGEVE